MNIRFIPEGPALLVKNRKRVLVVADLHIGIEAELKRRGWHVSSRTGERLERLLSCISIARPDLLILLGDIKHNLPKTTGQEYRELPGFLDAIRSSVSIRVLPGNHDTFISRFIHPEELMNKAGAVIDRVGYLHGHTTLSPALEGRLVVAGHHHPLVAIRDSVGCSLRSPAYLLAALNPECIDQKREGRSLQENRKDAGMNCTRVLFMPAFNECAGFDILQIVRHPFSPLSRAIQPESAEIFLPDGTYIGPICCLEVPDGTA